jgi:hypothetical protein
VTKALSNACAMEEGYWVSGIGYREQKNTYSPISFNIFVDATHGSAAFPQDVRQDARKKNMAFRAIISRAIGEDRANFHFFRASQEKGAPV